MKKLILLALSLNLVTPLVYAEKPHGPKEMIDDPDIWADIVKVAKALTENKVLTDWQIEKLLLPA